MKTEFIDVTDTQKNLIIEIPSTEVDAEIDRVARTYTRSARVPGFRPGKVPDRIVRQRYRDQILHDVAHGLIPRAVDEALRERGLEPVDTPDIRDVTLEEGQPLKFTAAFETLPPIEPGEYDTIVLRRPEANVEETDVADALTRLRNRHARFEPVADRAVEHGDTIVADLEREIIAGSTNDTAGKPETMENVQVEIGAQANPPGFDAHLLGLTPGVETRFTVTFPDDYGIQDLAGKSAKYAVTVKEIKKRVLPELDDEFAKDVGDFASLDELSARVRQDLEAHATHDADRDVRGQLLKQLADRVRGDVPASLVEREIDRRVEDFVRRLIEQRIDPTRANVNWDEFREHQREPSVDAVKAALVLDEIAERETLEPTDDEVGDEVERYAQRSGRTAAAVRARLEKEGGIDKVAAGLRREKAIDFVLTRARIVSA